MYVRGFATSPESIHQQQQNNHLDHPALVVSIGLATCPSTSSFRIPCKLRLARLSLFCCSASEVLDSASLTSSIDTFPFIISPESNLIPEALTLLLLFPLCIDTLFTVITLVVRSAGIGLGMVVAGIWGWDGASMACMSSYDGPPMACRGPGKMG